jgi:hypothetical protein
MKRGSLGWYRYRMISGLIFSLMGIVIGFELLRAPGPLQNKIVGLGFSIAVIALGIARVVQYLQARPKNDAGAA